MIEGRHGYGTRGGGVLGLGRRLWVFAVARMVLAVVRLTALVM